MTDTVNTVDKSRSITGTNLSNKINRIEKPTEIDIVKDNRDLYDLSLHGDDSLSITADILHIHRKNKIKKSIHFDH